MTHSANKNDVESKTKFGMLLRYLRVHNDAKDPHKNNSARMRHISLATSEAVTCLPSSDPEPNGFQCAVKSNFLENTNDTTSPSTCLEKIVFGF
jgi:hypothetical protein